MKKHISLLKKKTEKYKIHIAAVLCAAFGWWGLLYPELTLTPDTVQLICSEEDIPYSTKSSLYLELLSAEPGSICFKSRLFTELAAFWEAFSWDNSIEN